MTPRISLPQRLLSSGMYLLRPSSNCLLHRPATLVHPPPPRTTILIRAYANPPQKKAAGQQGRRKPIRSSFRQYDLRDCDQYCLTEAMRYLRAFEVGQDAVKTKYELAVKLHAMKNGPTIKNRVKLPKPVKTDMKICVIADGPMKEAALKAGAVLAGTTEVFEKIKAGEINFNQCICHEPSYTLLLKSRVAAILGPRGLMPSPKFNTVVSNPAAAIKELTGQSDYRERMGVVRIAIGQLGFSEHELAKNIMAFMDSLKKEIGSIQNRTEKEIREVVLSTTHGPGFSLNGDVKPAVTADVPPAGIVAGAATNQPGRENPVEQQLAIA